MKKGSDYAVLLSHVSKKYSLHYEKPTLSERLLSFRKLEEFWALRNINLEVKKGEKVGIIGDNGSGKTTLLKIMAGITKPTSGVVETYGRVVSLIDLEAGFHPDLTGEENIYLNAMLLGMSRKETKKKLDKIISFADIGHFIDAPLFTYSDGMKLRLGFSIAIHTNPDILLLDENLSVGDQDFQKKSFRKIKDLFKEGRTIILVNHNLLFVKKLCNYALWVDSGKIKRQGRVKEVIDNYQRIL